MRVCSCSPGKVLVRCQLRRIRAHRGRAAGLTNLSCELTGTVKIVKLVTGSCLPAQSVHRLAVSTLEHIGGGEAEGQSHP